MSPLRIAIPVSGAEVANHLGHCEKFMIADVEDGHVKQKVELPNPGHGPGGPPPMFLMRLGVNQIVAWGMPAHAQGMFAQMGINVLLGATGQPDQVLSDFLSGSLKLTTEGLDGGFGGGCHHEDHC